MITKKLTTGIIVQIALLFLISTIAVSGMTYVSERVFTTRSVKKQTEALASRIKDEVAMSVMEYPAYEWLLRYWYENGDDLEIEYDVDYVSGALTAEKSRLWNERHPDILLKYAKTSELENLPEDDQKLYAEIVYSWVITRINQIKRSYAIDYLFCVLTDEAFETQFFVLSAADPGAARGTHYEEVYPLGKTVTVSDSQSEAMRGAAESQSHLADADKYVDYYGYMCTVDDKIILVGMTYDLSDLIRSINAEALTETTQAAAFQVVLSIAFLLLIYSFVLKPLKKIQYNIRLYKETKDSADVVRNLTAVRPHNEIGQLSEDITDLTKEIDEYIDRIEKITGEKERMATELTLASKIQLSMLPSTFPAFPDRSEFDIFAVMDPAREVGGDFYDFFLVDNDHLCLLIADVSGKGIPAALFMMASRIILKNNAMIRKTSPAEILEAANIAICDNNSEEMFVTVWLGILELSTGKLKAANAGHEYPVIKNPGGKFELFKDRHSFVLGGFDRLKYKEYELQLEPGSTLFVYTDGLPESINAENEMFGTERMLKVLNEDVNATPEDIMVNITAAVNEYVSDVEQFDDLTMMCLTYKGK